MWDLMLGRKQTCRVLLRKDRTAGFYCRSLQAQKQDKARLASTKWADCELSRRLHSLRGSPAKAAVHRAIKPKNAATCLTAAVSPNGSMLLEARMSAIARQQKAFNNYIGFERDFWGPKMGRFSCAKQEGFLIRHLLPEVNPENDQMGFPNDLDQKQSALETGIANY